MLARQTRFVYRRGCLLRDSSAIAHAESPTISFVAALWPAPGAGRLVRAALLALGRSAVMTLSAKLQVPFYRCQ